ncbi:hypothetical protein HYDPIDRAFT_94801 [Hydnomerulius pinastri MD-312]|uniref:Uncharacterized protein n=1 Tax=Hydnomerulius pinastri MD-312 TaxID=994086 RepID=A0A0C9V9G6_9AGAM|nr:hypothetical protein HYDPIDRAFT_94801 [Hydnomerulius pinastri MD-312]
MAHGIPLDKAAVVSTLLEALLYGFSLLMFGGTIWALSSRRTTGQINRKMFSVACSLLVFSTTHLVIDVIRVVDGLVTYRDTFPGGPVGFFSDVSQWTFVYKNYIYTAQTLIGDGVILYRCYAVWQSKRIMVLPLLLYCGVAVSGIGSPYTASQVSQNEVFAGSLGEWITSFYALTLSTNLLTTAILAYRIWHVDRKAANIRGRRNSQLRPILHVIVDAGVIYSFTLLAALVCFCTKSNGQFVVLDMVTPIISITFYMVIIRVGMTNRGSRGSTVYPLGYASNSLTRTDDRRTYERNRMQVHITTLTESKVDNLPPAHSLSESTDPGEDKIDEVEEV